VFDLPFHLEEKVEEISLLEKVELGFQLCARRSRWKTWWMSADGRKKAARPNDEEKVRAEEEEVEEEVSRERASLFS